MDPLLVLLLQMSLTLVIIFLIARWFVAPRLSALSAENALVPLVRPLFTDVDFQHRGYSRPSSRRRTHPWRPAVHI